MGRYYSQNVNLASGLIYGGHYTTKLTKVYDRPPNPEDGWTYTGKSSHGYQAGFLWMADEFMHSDGTIEYFVTFYKRGTIDAIFQEKLMEEVDYTTLVKSSEGVVEY